MSFGRPSNMSLTLKPAPPERGSFPLDHDGECKDYMKRYLDCMKQSKNKSTDCRHLSKEYLNCRMEKGLMERASWEDLGFQESKAEDAASQANKPTAKHDHPPQPGLSR